MAGVICFCAAAFLGMQTLSAAPNQKNEKNIVIKGAGSETPHVIVSPEDKLPKVTAKSAVIMEAKTGSVLYERDMKERKYPASTTKIMTLIVALEHGNLDDIVTVSRHAAGTEGSTLWLEEGERLPLRDLLYGMMMMSGNDATIAVAEHIAGSVDKFVDLMNQKAAEIGAEDTHFVNPNGLPQDAHYSTAYDLALIASYGYRNPVFEEIVSTKEKTLDWIKDPKHMWRNENQMLWLSDGANGVKTGYTEAAGRCLVSAAKRDGVQVVSVVLDSLYMWNDSIAMLNYAFTQVEPKKYLSAGEGAGSIRLRSGRKNSLKLTVKDELVAPVVKESTENYQVVYDLPESVDAPIAEGETVGKAYLMHGGREIASVDVIAAESVERKSFFLTMKKWILDLLK